MIPQGTVLAPLLFLIYYITDLPKNILSPIKLCADDHDVFIYRTIESEHDHIILQQDLNKLQEWANAWLMSFNPSKCEMIRNKKNPIVGNYYIQNHPIKVVTHAKYLGVTIDKHLTFNEHICIISYKANSFYIRRNIKFCPPKVKEICYKIMIRPIVEYACTIWSPYYTRKNIQSLEAVLYKERQLGLLKIYNSSVANAQLK